MKLSDEYKKLTEENERISGGDKKLQEFLDNRDKEYIEKEEKRIKDILSKQDEWGEELCNWMVENKIDPYKTRTTDILNRLHKWGEETCKDLLTHRLSIGNTVEMVALSLGQPTDIDNKELTAKSNKFRYVYGAPRQGAVYIWFKDGKVVKIKTP
jgi:hypothetical protein